jgi:hypothetical protein
MCSHVEMSGSRTEPFPQESSTRQDVWVKDKALRHLDVTTHQTIYNSENLFWEFIKNLQMLVSCQSWEDFPFIMIYSNLCLITGKPLINVHMFYAEIILIHISA